MEEKPTADRISELPDEILHCILSRVKPQRVAAQTITLSRRWRGLWRSYPVVTFSTEDGLAMKNFQKFGKATLERFSRDRFLRMETLTLNIHVRDNSPVLKQLLNLSSERKAEEINICASALSFPFPLLSNSATKILRITGAQFLYDRHCHDLPLSLNSLRFLQLHRVYFDDDRAFQNLIDSSPLLETLEIGLLYGMRELKVSTHHANLTSLRIARCSSAEIEIAAPGLQTLRLDDLNCLSKFELTAPQLKLLEITHSDPAEKDRCFDLVIPNLRSLKSLTINDPELQKKLKLSNPKLKICF
ncbi:F-box/FBD/LRR-repeat protein At4g00160 [Linum grandiflorum]